MSNTIARPVRATDKVSDVLSRDERLVEVFASQSPHFDKLRKPGMRRVMARLVTVEQAARMCGAEPSALVQELNHALGFDGGNGYAGEAGATEAARDQQTDIQHAMASQDQRDTSSARPPVRRVRNPWEPGAPIVELDVREDLQKGREPFSRIMAAVAALREGEALCLRATFEPVPLYTVMQKRGYDHFSERLDTDDWRVWFYPHDPELADDDEGEGEGVGAEPEAPVVAASASEVVLDVRGLEPPEPMQRTLEALTDLPGGAVLVQVNVRVPHFLLPILKERGFDYEIYQPNPERVVVRIWRAAPDASTRESVGG